MGMIDSKQLLDKAIELTEHQAEFRESLKESISNFADAAEESRDLRRRVTYGGCFNSQHWDRGYILPVRHVARSGRGYYIGMAKELDTVVKSHNYAASI